MFKGFSISTLAVLPLLLTSAIAHPAPEAEPEPESLETRSLDATVKWHNDRHCGGSGGPKRDYSAGTCLPLSQSTYSVKILDLRAGCIRKYLLFLS